MNRIIQYTTAIAAVAMMFASCADKDYEVPVPKSELQNDAIKRNLGPNMAGSPMEFVYAMALPADKGKLVSAQVEASITGAANTYMEHRSYYTNGSGQDIGVEVAAPSENKDNVTEVTFNKDTMAAALRYYYYPDASARGKEVTFKFTARASNGETVSFDLGPYKISNMEMTKNISVADGGAMYISIEDMTAYSATDAAANAGKIDLVYLYRSTPASFGHSLVAPAADAEFLPGVTLPAGVNRDAKLMKVWELRDQQLSDDQYGVFIDDSDFEKLDLGDDATDHVHGLVKDHGVWVETADGKYRAYVFINKANSGATATISIKRYTMK